MIIASIKLQGATLTMPEAMDILQMDAASWCKLSEDQQRAKLYETFKKFSSQEALQEAGNKLGLSISEIKKGYEAKVRAYVRALNMVQNGRADSFQDRQLARADRSREGGLHDDRERGRAGDPARREAIDSQRVENDKLLEDALRKSESSLVREIEEYELLVTQINELNGETVGVISDVSLRQTEAEGTEAIFGEYELKPEGAPGWDMGYTINFQGHGNIAEGDDELLDGVDASLGETDPLTEDDPLTDGLDMDGLAEPASEGEIGTAPWEQGPVAIDGVTQYDANMDGLRNIEDQLYVNPDEIMGLNTVFMELNPSDSVEVLSRDSESKTTVLKISNNEGASTTVTINGGEMISIMGISDSNIQSIKRVIDDETAKMILANDSMESIYTIRMKEQLVTDQEAQLRAIPGWVGLKNGEDVSSFTGEPPSPSLQNAINKLVDFYNEPDVTIEGLERTWKEVLEAEPDDQSRKSLAKNLTAHFVMNMEKEEREKYFNPVIEMLEEVIENNGAFGWEESIEATDETASADGTTDSSGTTGATETTETPETAPEGGPQLVPETLSASDKFSIILLETEFNSAGKYGGENIWDTVFSVDAAAQLEQAVTEANETEDAAPLQNYAQNSMPGMWLNNASNVQAIQAYMSFAQEADIMPSEKPREALDAEQKFLDIANAVEEQQAVAGGDGYPSNTMRYGAEGWSEGYDAGYEMGHNPFKAGWMILKQAFDPTDIDGFDDVLYKGMLISSGFILGPGLLLAGFATGIVFAYTFNFIGGLFGVDNLGSKIVGGAFGVGGAIFGGAAGVVEDLYDNTLGRLF